MKSSLDYETLRNFSFTLIVTDGGLPALNDSATVYVTVTDSNDNSPYFTNPVSPFQVDISLYEGPYSEYEIFDVSLIASSMILTWRYNCINICLLSLV